MSSFISSKINGNEVGADEWNQLADYNAFISSSRQTPSTSNTNQGSIAAASYASGGQFYLDTGTANAYVLNTVSPFKAPVDATVGYFVGMTIRFRAGNANTGASTVNVNSAGVKNLKKEDGTTDLAAGDIPTNRDSVFRYNGTAFIQVIEAIFATTSTSGTALLPSPITIANNATDAVNDVDFSAGNFIVSDRSAQGVAPSVEVKRLDATWAAGNNAGGLAAGLTKTNSTWYHCFKLLNPTTGATGSGFDVNFNASNLLASAAVMAAGFTKVAWRGAVYVSSLGAIATFRQDGKTINLTTQVSLYDSTAIAVGSTNLSILSPHGIRVKSLMFGIIDGNNLPNNMLITDKFTNQQKTVLAAGLFGVGAEFFCYTDSTTALIGIGKSDAGGTLDRFFIAQVGWEIPDNLY